MVARTVFREVTSMNQYMIICTSPPPPNESITGQGTDNERRREEQTSLWHTMGDLLVVHVSIREANDSDSPVAVLWAERGHRHKPRLKSALCHHRQWMKHWNVIMIIVIHLHMVSFIHLHHHFCAINCLAQIEHGCLFISHTHTQLLAKSLLNSFPFPLPLLFLCFEEEEEVRIGHPCKK